jgi:hypothetical protein
MDLCKQMYSRLPNGYVLYCIDMHTGVHVRGGLTLLCNSKNVVKSIIEVLLTALHIHPETHSISIVEAPVYVRRTAQMDARSRNKNIFTYLVYVHRIYRLISQLIISLLGVALVGLQLPLHPVQRHPGWGLLQNGRFSPLQAPYEQQLHIFNWQSSKISTYEHRNRSNWKSCS